MKSNEEIRQIVKGKYSQIALQEKKVITESCCSPDCCTDDVYKIMSDDYSKLEGYNPDADLGLGCGLPTQFAKIKEGDTVIDLGSGAGNDCFIARHETGEAGKVIGIDFSEAMIEKARENANKPGYNNVDFLHGEIERIPINENVADVVISNCVLNLIPDKKKTFQEIFRILKPGGHFSISDIVLKGELPQKLRQSVEMYTGCISGAIQKSDYLQIMGDTGFKHISIQNEKIINIPEEILRQYLTRKEIGRYKEGKAHIISITVYGEKIISQDK